MMTGLRKAIVKTMSENVEQVIGGKEHMYFKRYQQTCKLLKKMVHLNQHFPYVF